MNTFTLQEKRFYTMLFILLNLYYNFIGEKQTLKSEIIIDRNEKWLVHMRGQLQQVRLISAAPNFRFELLGISDSMISNNRLIIIQTDIKFVELNLYLL